MLPDDERNDAWKQYETLADLYKFYLDQLTKFHSFYFAIAGGLVVFVLANRQGGTPLVLLLPLVISLGGIATFVFGIRKSRELTDAIKAVARLLGILSAHTEVLEFLCWAFLAVHLLIAAGLISLLVLLGPGIALTLPPLPATPG
ncbi:MAG TPA: hypothetical protein VEW04_06475 [Allosphingosinicella sp.]|nr:hypothetical protein [Allosphingosinicella sp.]